MAVRELCPSGLVWLGEVGMELTAAYLLHWQLCDGPAGPAVLGLGNNRCWQGMIPNCSDPARKAPFDVSRLWSKSGSTSAEAPLLLFVSRPGQAFPCVPILHFPCPFSHMFAGVLE